jgi:hypothetical protein
MQCFQIEELMGSEMPTRLPANTRMGVWKRSTGYEVILPYSHAPVFWVLLAAGLVGLIAAEYFIAFYFYPDMPSLSIGQRALWYFGFVLPVVGYITAIVVVLSIARTAQVRIDMTPLTMMFTRIRPSGPAKKVGEVAVRQIETICIDESRGLRIEGSISEMTYFVWVARGLRYEDLHYLALLMGKNAQMNLQDTGGHEAQLL